MYYGNFIKWVWKNTWNSSKTAPNPASFKVEHDFLKTVLPMVILKWISQPSNCLAFSKWLGLLHWLAKLARLLVFDFEQLLRYFLQDDISFYFLVDFFEHVFWKKREPIPAKLEVEHDFLKTVLPLVILKLVCQPSNFTKLLNP